MGIIIDVFVILFIVFCVYRGYKRGIVDVGIKLFSIVVSLLASIILCGPITNFVVKNTEVDEKIETIIIEKLTSNTENNKEQEETDLNAFIQNYAKNIAKDTQNTVVESAAKTISFNVVRIRSYNCTIFIN